MTDTADTKELRAELERKAAEPKQATVLELLERMKPRLEERLADSIGYQRFASVLLNEYRRVPELWDCDPHSTVGAMLYSTQHGLEPGPLGHVYFIPKKIKGVKSVLWVMGYTGIVKLAREGGAVGLRASVIWDCDEYVEPWENEKGLHWRLKPGPVEKQSERVGVLVAWKEGSERLALHCPPSRIDRALAASSLADNSRREADWYWRKTAIRFARPWLPLGNNVSIAAAFNLDEQPAPNLDEDTAELEPVIEEGDE